MIMRWSNVQTNEYDLQAKTYPTICTHHKLHNINENKFIAGGMAQTMDCATPEYR